jgi:putative ATP-binding cassette transporter
MDPKKGNEIFEDKILKVAIDAYKNNTNAYIRLVNSQMTGQILFYILIASILIYFSVTLGISPPTTVNFLFILLYMLGSIESIMAMLPSIIHAKVAYQKVNELQDELNLNVNEDIQIENVTISKNEFEGIVIQGLTYSYNKADSNTSFKIGPVDLSIQQGDILFIYGGNGSGKTTFINVLLGVLKAEKESIFFNGMLLNRGNYNVYKSLFAVVFNDFYLFDEFYGNKQFNVEKAKAYLLLFEMEKKVKITQKGFSTIDLSAGQRKRLSLITALLEEKPVIVLDEWAADQDPYFRKKFYTVIIPYIKNEGFTLLAITHDDAYYQYADKLYKMDFGKLHKETRLTNALSF